MTIREYIKRRVWVTMAILFVGFLVYDRLVNIVKTNNPRYIFGLGFLLIIGPVLVLPQLIRCPKCSHRLGGVARRIAFPLFGRMKHCPYCAVDLDEPMPTKLIS